MATVGSVGVDSELASDILNASDEDLPDRPQEIIGWVMWSTGISDQQKLALQNNPANRGK
jgi:hypothetical protein